MKLLVFILFCFSLLSIRSIAQNKIENYNNFDNVSFFNAEEVNYQVNILSVEYKQLSCTVNFRVEDELTSDETYILLQDMTFFDIQFNYTFGPFYLALFVENLLGLKDMAFSVEPVLDIENGASMIYFSHEPNFILSTSIAFRF